MVNGETETLGLLRRWHEGDQNALSEILRRDLPRIREKVGRRLGPGLRKKESPSDIVQDAVVDLLKYGPRFRIADKDQFRGLVAKIVENNLRDKNDRYRAQRRALDRERPLPAGSVVDLNAARKSVEGPSTVARRNEDEALIRLALELLDPRDRQVVLLRQFEGLSFSKVGKALGIEANTARMRFKRALPKLAEKLEMVEGGKVGSLLRETS